MKQILLFLLFSVALQAAISQTPGFAWVKTANGTAGEQTNDIVISKDNFVYSCGVFSSASVQIGSQTLTNAGGNDIFLAKYDTAGNLTWAKSYGGSGADNAVAIATDSLNNIYLIGSTTGTVSFGGLSFPGGNFLLKVNGAGTETWIIEPAVNATLTDVAADPAGNAAICGYFSVAATVGPQILTPTTSNDGFVAKFTSTGGFSWMRHVYSTPPVTYPEYSSQSDDCLSVAISPDGRVGVCGSSGGPKTIIMKNNTYTDSIITTQTFDSQRTYGPEGFVFQLDANGLFLWGKDNLNDINSGRYWTKAFNMAASPAGELYIGAETLSRASSSGFYYPKVVKYSNTGNREWMNTRPGTGLNFIVFPQTNPRVAYYGGNVYHSEKNPNNFLDTNYQKTKVNCINAFGTLQWSSTFTGINADINSLAAKENAYSGGFLSSPVFGNLTATYAAGNDGYVTKLKDYTSSILPLSFSSVNPDKTICPGGSVAMAPSITVSGGVQPYTYNWTPAVFLSNATLLNPTATPPATTNFIVAVTDAAGSILRDTVQVTVRPQLVIPVITIVPGAPASFFDTLVCNSPETGLIYQWNPTNGLATANKLPVSKTGNGIYTVTTTNGLSGCSSTSDLFYHNTVKANAGNDTTVCKGQPVTLGGYPEYFGMAVGNVTYVWTSTDAGYFGSVITNPHIIINPLITANYILTIQDQSGNTKISDTVKITVNTATNTWAGNINTQWENPGNWSCGGVPNSFSEVTITSGTVIINSNVTIYSLILGAGANLVVTPGNTLTILH
jgi:hypothetical protein